MYAKPVLAAVDATAAEALCCTISSETFIIRTPLCPFPTCGIIQPCTVTVGPVTISGN